MVFINGLEIVNPSNEVCGPGDCMQRAYESILEEIMDFMIESVCFESHRALKLGYYPIHDYMVNEQQMERYRSMVVMPEEERDIFFNDLNNEIPMSTCPFCYQRKAAHTLVRHMNLCRRINENSFDWNIRRRENDEENDINRSNVVENGVAENGVVVNGFAAVAAAAAVNSIARNRFAVHRMENGVSENDLATNGSATNRTTETNVATNRSEMDRTALNRISMNRMIMNRIAMNRIVLNRMALNHVALSRITMNGIARNDRIGFGRNDIFGNDINGTNRNDIAEHGIQENGTDDESNSDYEDYNIHEDIPDLEEEEEEEYADGDAAADDRDDDGEESTDGEEESTDGDEEEEYTDDEEEEYADAEDDSDANRENVNDVDPIIVDSVRRSAEEIIGSFARRSAEEIIGSFASRSAEEIIGSFARRSAEEMMGSFIRRSANDTIVDSVRRSAEDSGSPDDLSTPDSPISEYGGSEIPLSPELPLEDSASSAPPPVNHASSAPPPVNRAFSAPPPVNRAFSVPSPDDHTCTGSTCDYFDFPAYSPSDLRAGSTAQDSPDSQYGSPDSPALSASALSPVPQEVYMTPATTPEHPLSPASPPMNDMSRDQGDYFSRRCGVISEINGRPCLNSMDCPVHSIEFQSADSNSTYDTHPDKKSDSSSSDYDSLD